MKRTFMLLLIGFYGCRAFGQGTIQFTNRGLGLDAPVRNAAGDLVPNDAVKLGVNLCGLYFVRLSVGDSPTNLTEAASAMFQQFQQPGYFGLGQPEVVLPGFAPGSHPWLRVNVYCYADFCVTPWELPGEIVEDGYFGPFQLEPTGPGLGAGNPESPAPPLFGLHSFQLSRLVPQPRPWIGSPFVFGTNVVVYWGGENTVMRTFTLQKAPHPDGPWNVVTNARANLFQTPALDSSAFFRVAGYVRSLSANEAGGLTGASRSAEETNRASSTAGFRR